MQQQPLKTATLPYRAGVYKVVCRPTGSCYFGTSLTMGHRVKEHRWQLASGRHHNSRLQSLYDRFGINTFWVELIRILPDRQAMSLDRYGLGIERGLIDATPKCINRRRSDPARRHGGKHAA